MFHQRLALACGSSIESGTTGALWAPQIDGNTAWFCRRHRGYATDVTIRPLILRPSPARGGAGIGRQEMKIASQKHGLGLPQPTTANSITPTLSTLFAAGQEQENMLDVFRDHVIIISKYLGTLEVLGGSVQSSPNR